LKSENPLFLIPKELKMVLDLDYVKSLEVRIVELEEEVSQLRALKDKRTMIKMRQFGSLSAALTQYREHLKLIDVVMFKWYDAYMNGDMDALISELLNDRRGYCDIKDCNDCEKGIALECVCQEDWEK